MEDINSYAQESLMRLYEETSMILADKKTQRYHMRSVVKAAYNLKD